MNALQVLNDYGFPKGIDNTRVKPFVLHDTQQATTTVLNFFRSAPTLFVNNKQLPLASDECYLIDCIKVLIAGSRTTIPAFTSQVVEIFTNSYLLITVNETQKIKLPLWEVVNFNYADIIGSAGITVQSNVRSKRGARRLKYPIILYKNANVNFQVVLSANAQGALAAGGAITLELSGVKLDFISPNELDPVSNNNYEKISTTLYNTVPVTNAATTFNLFSDRTTPEERINKYFPLSETEVFSIEAVEILYISRSASVDLATAMIEARKLILKININSTDFYFGQNNAFISLIHAATSANFNDAGAVATAFQGNTVTEFSPEIFGFANKGVPIIVPSQTQNAVTLQKDASTTLTDFITVMLKGTLERRLT